MTVSERRTKEQERPLLGLRSRPGRLALQLMGLPRPFYRHGWGWIFGHTFLMVTHRGRKTGCAHDTVAMALDHDAQSHEVVVCSAWGADTQWIRNLRSHPALRVRIGRETFRPAQHFLSEDESLEVARQFRCRHPCRFRLLAWILGWGDLASDPGMREFVRSRPFVSFRPQASVETHHGEVAAAVRSGNEPNVQRGQSA